MCVTELRVKMQQKLHKHMPYGGYKVVACAYHGKTLLYGINCPKSHPLQKQYGKNAQCIYLHAEIALLAQLKRLQYVPRCVYVLRMSKSAQWLPSKPCSHCQKALGEYGIMAYCDIVNGKKEYLYA